jgi:drug/metabolite transporter (DMT)-like permease
MKALAGAVVVLAGAIMFAAGVIGAAILNHANRASQGEVNAGFVCGCFVGLVGLVLLLTGFATPERKP